jgi:hypothetical protein
MIRHVALFTATFVAAAVAALALPTPTAAAVSSGKAAPTQIGGIVSSIPGMTRKMRTAVAHLPVLGRS